MVSEVKKIPMDPPKNDYEKVKMLKCHNETCKYHYDGICLYGRISFDFVMGAGVVCTTYEAKEVKVEE